MDNLWPSDFGSDDTKAPNEIIEEQLTFLPKMTSDYVYGELIPVEKRAILPGFFATVNRETFTYSLIIKGKYLEKYSFEVLMIEFKIPFYPIKINVNEDIMKELEQKETWCELKNEKDFIEYLSKVFGSERLKEVIRAIVKISAVG